jgi:predicted transcriptional regulator
MTGVDKKLWDAIPVGEENAAPAIEIWRRLDMLARPTIQHKLCSLAEEGKIDRKSRPLPTGGEKRLYYKRSGSS